MDRIPLEPGRAVLAKAGRDEGRVFVILKLVNEEYCLIADGETRKAYHPKLKKNKHLRAMPSMMEMPEKGTLTDAYIRKFLTGEAKKEG